MHLSIELKSAVGDLARHQATYRGSWRNTDCVFLVSTCCAFGLSTSATFLITAIVLYALLRYDGAKKLQYIEQTLAQYPSRMLPRVTMDAKGIILPLIIFPIRSKIGQHLLRFRQPCLAINWDQIQSWELVSMALGRQYPYYHEIHIDGKKRTALFYLLRVDLPIPSHKSVVIKAQLFITRDADVRAFARHFLALSLSDSNPDDFTWRRFFSKIPAPY